MRFILIALAICAGPATALAQDYPLHVPASGGEVILPNAAAKRIHDQYRYAAGRRVGDTLYLSGVIVYRAPGEGNDVAAFKAQTRRALDQLGATLTAAGANFQDVAMINSFHVWQGPNFAGSREEQFQAFNEVLAEYVAAPYPAWTAVGTSATLADSGILEVQMIAHVADKS